MTTITVDSATVLQINEGLTIIGLFLIGAGFIATGYGVSGLYKELRVLSIACYFAAAIFFIAGILTILRDLGIISVVVV